MKINRQIVVFDAADMEAESAFWAAVFEGTVRKDDDWHAVKDSEGDYRIAVQLAPEHKSPNWPDGDPQQLHLDLWVDDLAAAHEQVIKLGAKLLKSVDANENFQVYADPAGHPFCLVQH